MNFIRNHKLKIITAVCLTAVLAVAFLAGDNNSAVVTEKTAEPVTEFVSEPKSEPVKAPPVQTAPEPENFSGIVAESPQINTDKEELQIPGENVITDTVEQNTESSDGQSEDTDAESVELTCTVSVRCDSVVGKTGEKDCVIPDDGIIFPEQSVVFYEGETVFNVLVREMKKNGIHLEFVNVPVYNSAYIEGINNLYEFDFGELSGWMYCVNGWFPDYGCSGYQLKAGDRIEWVYTCDLGADVGGRYSARNGR